MLRRSRRKVDSGDEPQPAPGAGAEEPADAPPADDAHGSPGDPWQAAALRQRLRGTVDEELAREAAARHARRAARLREETARRRAQQDPRRTGAQGRAARGAREDTAGDAGRARRLPEVGTMPPDPYEVLGLPPTATWAEVKAAHRRLAREHHPDRLQHLGAAERAPSEERIREVNGAYNELWRRRSHTALPGI